MQIRYTSKAKKAIDQASKMSKSLHHHYIGTEHILIGLLKEGTGGSAFSCRGDRDGAYPDRDDERDRVCGIPPFKYLSGQYPENVCGYPDRNGRRCEPVQRRFHEW